MTGINEKEKMYTLNIDELEVGYLLSLVLEDDEKLKSHSSYEAYTTLFSVKAKLEKLAKREFQRQEDARDREIW